MLFYNGNVLFTNQVKSIKFLLNRVDSHEKIKTDEANAIRKIFLLESERIPGTVFVWFPCAVPLQVLHQ